MTEDNRIAHRPHGFEAVDEQADPSGYVRCLGVLARDPFYRKYKARVSELLDLKTGEAYLDVGGGNGNEAAERARTAAVDTVLVDRSATMCAEARQRGVRDVVLADAAALPFSDHAFHACSADRVLQHVHDPIAVLREMVRVTCSGGRIVLADPDYDTQVVVCADQELARRVLRFRADHLLRNGTLAHQLPGLLATIGVTDITVEGHVLIVREPTALDNVMGLRTWAEEGYMRGVLSAEDATRWPEQLDETAQTGCFFYSVTFFLTSARVP
ncbi:MAG: methyltransferase domain-containing protein [Acidobacteriota bacterium]